MKIKTIRQVLSKQFDEWVESISEESVRELPSKINSAYLCEIIDRMF